MYRINKIGMDVHSKNYTLCAMEPTIGSEDRFSVRYRLLQTIKRFICFIESLKMKLGFYDDYSVECGYERGASVIPFTTSSQTLGSNVSYLHRLPCLPSRESESKRISVMLV